MRTLCALPATASPLTCGKRSRQTLTPNVSVHEPQWWTEDYTLDEAEQLAGLLRAARDLVAR